MPKEKEPAINPFSKLEASSDDNQDSSSSQSEDSPQIPRKVKEGNSKAELESSSETASNAASDSETETPVKKKKVETKLEKYFDPIPTKTSKNSEKAEKKSKKISEDNESGTGYILPLKQVSGNGEYEDVVIVSYGDKEFAIWTDSVVYHLLKGAKPSKTPQWASKFSKKIKWGGYNRLCIPFDQLQNLKAELSEHTEKKYDISFLEQLIRQSLDTEKMKLTEAKKGHTFAFGSQSVSRSKPQGKSTEEGIRSCPGLDVLNFGIQSLTVLRDNYPKIGTGLRDQQFSTSISCLLQK